MKTYIFLLSSVFFMSLFPACFSKKVVQESEEVVEDIEHLLDDVEDVIIDVEA